jgi:hypothetical protein
MPVFRIKPYLRGMRDMGIDEAGMADIEAELIANPTHPMIRGLKGARKARIQRSGMGKRGGGRVVYYVALGTDRFYMMAAYPKSSGTTYQPRSVAEFWWRSKASRSREASNGAAEQSAGISPQATRPIGKEEPEY